MAKYLGNLFRRDTEENLETTEETERHCSIEECVIVSDPSLRCLCGFETCGIDLCVIE